jgi:hypothetical protein
MPSIRAPHHPTVGELEVVGLKSVMVLIAMGMVAVGFTTLTSMLAIPFTLALWLGAAAIVGVVVFGRFPTS